MTTVPPNIQQLRDKQHTLKYCLHRMQNSTITEVRKELSQTIHQLIMAEAESEKLEIAKRANHYHGLS